MNPIWLPTVHMKYNGVHYRTQRWLEPGLEKYNQTRERHTIYNRYGLDYVNCQEINLEKKNYMKLVQK